jgi:hypothetical protein
MSDRMKITVNRLELIKALDCIGEATPTNRVCQHCHCHRVNRPRGLCWSCYYRPGVRDQYPSTSHYANRGHGIGCFTGATPEPTTAAPGTPEKMAVLAERARRRESLFHDDDAT